MPEDNACLTVDDAPLTERAALTDYLKVIADQSKQSPDRQVVAAAGVLLALSSALLTGDALQLFDHIAPYLEQRLENLQPQEALIN